jgi:two-component system, NarL family, nitrate/nitrite response regulator NarL
VTIRLVIADDHPVVLAGLANYLAGEKDFEVVARAVNGEEALKAVRQLRPDVLVLDLRMPVKDGLTVLREMDQYNLPTRSIVLTALNNDEAVEAVRLGARGLLLKDTVSTQLFECIREVYAGRKWLEKDVAMRALDQFIERGTGLRSTKELLTRRELEVARMVVEGLPSKAIARKLSITEGTAKLHLHHVYEKLKINGRMALVRYMRSQQLD